ncbi:hypothetical protein Lumi_014 [Xylophilus phage Lumi]|nr:hypothetical protein Lumi_014 [Xylophilus phage Lumi]
MKRLTNTLFDPFVRIDGMRAMGTLTTAPAASTKDRAPYRVLTIRNPCLFESGDTLYGSNKGEKLILLDHPSDLIYARNFKVAYARRGFEWKRQVDAVDPVTGLPRSGGVLQTIGTVFANFDTPTDDVTLGLSETEYRFITGQAVLPDDYIGDKRVNKVVELLGARVVYAA